MADKTADTRGLPTGRQIDAFIDELASCPTAADALNQYARSDANNAIRRQNLRLYLGLMAQLMPRTLLLMEAPGYRGCRLTGLPVTSRKVMLENLPALGVFGEAAGFRDVADVGFESVYGEQSATIVWNTLAQMGVLPFIWNAYPFHPHRRGHPRSNRKPRKSELNVGVVYLRALLDLWAFEQAIAVGNVAFDALTRIGVNCHKVRHPAHGGKRDFVAGLQGLLAG